MKDLSQWTNEELASELAAMEVDPSSMRMELRFAHLAVAEYERRIGRDRQAERASLAARYLAQLQGA